MSTFYFAVTVALVLLLWAGVIYVARHWGVGYGNRSVRCPHEDKQASIATVAYAQGGWGTLVKRDVLQCSLLGEGPVTCDKSCLAQLQ